MLPADPSCDDSVLTTTLPDSDPECLASITTPGEVSAVTCTDPPATRTVPKGPLELEPAATWTEPASLTPLPARITTSLPLDLPSCEDPASIPICPAMVIAPPDVKALPPPARTTLPPPSPVPATTLTLPPIPPLATVSPATTVTEPPMASPLAPTRTDISPARANSLTADSIKISPLESALSEDFKCIDPLDPIELPLLSSTLPPGESAANVPPLIITFPDDNFVPLPPRISTLPPDWPSPATAETLPPDALSL